MRIRPMEPTEKSEIDRWALLYWKLNHTIPWKLIVEPWVCVDEKDKILAFVNTFPTDTGSIVRFITYTMANPDIKSSKKHAAIEFLLNGLEDRFIEDGDSYIATVTGSEQLISVLKEKVRFIEGEKGSILLKRIGRRKK